MSEQFRSIRKGLEEAITYERNFHDLAAGRICEGDANPRRQTVSLRDAMGEKEYAAYEQIDPDEILDRDLFEEDDATP